MKETQRQIVLSLEAALQTMDPNPILINEHRIVHVARAQAWAKVSVQCMIDARVKADDLRWVTSSFGVFNGYNQIGVKVRLTGKSGADFSFTHVLVWDRVKAFTVESYLEHLVSFLAAKGSVFDVVEFRALFDLSLLTDL